MRGWAKDHPWQMEIIPFLAFVMAVIFPLLCRAEAAPLMKPRHGFSPSQTWFLTYLAAVFATLLACILGFILYQAHIVNERETKRYDHWVILSTTQTVGLAVISTMLLIWRVCPWWMIVSWMILVLAAAVVPLVLEEARPFKSKPTIPDVDIVMPSETMNPNTSIYYHEAKEVRGQFSVLVLFAGICWISWWLEAFTLLTAVLFFGTAATMMALASRRKLSFVITNDCITVNRPLSKVGINIPLESIKCCSIEVKDPCESRGVIIRRAEERVAHLVDLRPTSILNEMVGNYRPDIRLKVETTGNRDYAFRLHDPEKACAVIKALLSADQ